MRFEGLPSRAHALAIATALTAFGLVFVQPALASLPLAVFVLACATAPFFPSWQFFLPVICRGPRGRPAVALTFDDGPDSRTLDQLLALLARAHAPATFFVVGNHVAANPALLDRIVAAGHEVGNHSQRHDPLLALRPTRRLEQEVAECQALLVSRGVVPLVFRPPVGITTPRFPGVLTRHGLRCVCFSCRPLDFGNRRIERLAERVLRRVRGGDVILLHDQVPSHAAAEPWLAQVAEILEGLRARGLEVVPLSDLLGVPVMERVAPGTGAPLRHLEHEPAPDDPPKTRGLASPPRSGRGRALLDWLLAVVQCSFLVAFPLLVYIGVPRFGVRDTAVGLGALLVPGLILSALRGKVRLRAAFEFTLAVGLLLTLAALLDNDRFMLAYPTFVNGALLVWFGWSLRSGPSLVETFARRQHADLRPDEIRYCRTVTLIWCGFFVVNGAVASGLALFCPRSWWALYTGAISYALIGLLFANEYVVRKLRFARYRRSAFDRFLASRLGQPEPE